MKKFEAQNDHPIHKVLIDGDAESVSGYLKEGVNPYLNGVIFGGIRGGFLTVMEVLLSNGVDVNKPFTESGVTPLMRDVEKRKCW